MTDTADTKLTDTTATVKPPLAEPETTAEQKAAATDTQKTEVIAERAANPETAGANNLKAPEPAAVVTEPVKAAEPVTEPVKAVAAPPAAPPAATAAELRDDGPTLAEYVAAGYRAENYPPQGYRARTTSVKAKRPPHPSTLPPGQRPAPQGS